MNITEICEKLNQSDLVIANEALKDCASTENAVVKTDDLVSCDELYEIYSGRAELLEKRASSPHAIQLLTATKEFLKNLAANVNGTGKWVTINGLGEHQYMLFFTQENKLIGCIKVVSQLDVTAKKWVQLWN